MSGCFFWQDKLPVYCFNVSFYHSIFIEYIKKLFYQNRD